MLIVEGSDCVGKTTLCNELIKQLNGRGYPVIPQHFGLLPSNWNYYDDYLPFMNTRTAMDRFIMSEVVYGHVIRNGTKLTPELYRRLDAHLRLQGSVTVVVTADDDWLRRQLRAKIASRQEAFNIDQIVAVNHAFRDLVSHYRDDDGCPDWVAGYDPDCDFVYHINGTNEMPSSAIEFVEAVVAKFIERQEVVKWNGTC